MSVSVWRIGYAKAITHTTLAHGSTLANGRWHVAPGFGGAAVVYAASSRALAQLEKRVHANGIAPVEQALLRLELPAKIHIDDSRHLLDKDWKKNEAYTQAYGTQWLLNNDALALWVPSVVEPRECNLLINPAHTRYASIKIIVEQQDFQFDARLFS